MKEFIQGLEILLRENPFPIIISDKTFRKLKFKKKMGKLSKRFKRRRII